MKELLTILARGLVEHPDDVTVTEDAPAEDGTVTVNKTDAPLMTNDGTEIVAAGGPSVDDGVITGSMNYNVEGVVVS